MNLSTNALTTIPNVSSSFGIASTPDGASALVSSGQSDTIKRISLSTNTVTATFPYGSNQDAHNVAITPDGTIAVVVGDFDIGILSLVTNTLITTYPGGGNSVAITPDGETALITSSSGGGTVKAIEIP